jgi:anti-anti-sigma regulatory factor
MARGEAAVELQQRLISATVHTDVAIDWEQTEHVDASVLQVLLALRQRLSGQGHSLTIARDNLQLREYLLVSGLSECFPLHDSSPADAGAQFSDSEQCSGKSVGHPLRSSGVSHG